MTEAISFRRVLPLGVFLGFAITIFNEVIFRYYYPSVAVSIACVALLCWALATGRVQSAITLMLFYFMAFATRPREIHTIDLQVRGSYEYYSPNILSLVGPSVTTLLGAVCALYVLSKWSEVRRTHCLSGVYALGILAAYATSVALIGVLLTAEPISVGNYISDVKYILFLFAGIGLYVLSGMSPHRLLEILLVIGAALGCSALIMFGLDELSGKHLLQYNHSTYFSIMVVGIMLVWRERTTAGSLVALTLIGFGAIPLVRGEQLVAAVTLLITFLFLLGMGGRVSNATKTGVVLLFAWCFAAYVLSEDNALSRFVIGKSQFFASLSGGFDHSTIVRSREAAAIFDVSNWQRVLQLVFGRGLGGTFSLESVSWLNLADYAREELQANRFRQPHLFVFHWILKFGIIGSVGLAFWHLRPGVRWTRYYVLYLICLPAVLWQSYWAPGFAFLGGILWAIGGTRSTPESGVV